MTAWRTFVAWLAALAADPVAVDLEPARSYAAVAAAYAAMRPDEPTPAPPAPSPGDCPCGGRCQGGQYKPDGRIVMRCVPGCRSCPKATTAEAPCPDGNCPPPKAVKR